MIAAILLAINNIQAKANIPESFEVGQGTFLLNGKPFIVKAAELHYPRIPRPYWEHRIKMCKALGMNTICLYVFWNIHEQEEGKFDFTGNNDVAEFCRLAQKNGMYIIVRPGPYVCAEWEMGGLPWWLLKKKDIRLREDDPYFLKRVEIFEKEVGGQLADLTIENGGPIIMVQVENEYGSYGENKPYVSKIRDILRKSGFDKVTLFQCDWASNFERNGLDDLVWTMNFGTGANIDNQFRRLKQLRPESPLMCSEFWSGWFDKWGARHETRPAQAMVKGIDEMLSKGISFSLYMTHGGTSFGHWAGANSPGFAPDVTSYDYDAPINEYGHATPKYYELRKIMQKYNDKKLPTVPKAPMKIIEIPQFEITEYAPISMGIKEETSINDGKLKTFEEMNMGWGSALYSTILPEIKYASILTMEAHDFAQIFINGKYIGKIDRVKKENSIVLPPVQKNDELIVLVEGMGRINFGRAIKDFKGILDTPTIQVTIDDIETTFRPLNWRIRTIPDDYETTVQSFSRKEKLKLNGLSINTLQSETSQYSSDSTDILKRPGYYRAYFNLKKVGDTFLNFETWGKGQVYINGHALGRFWSIGPQQTLYVPGCWLKKGKNEIIVLDVVGPKKCITWGQKNPEINKLQLKKSSKHNNPEERPDFTSDKPIIQGEFKNGNGWQRIEFANLISGNLLCIEALSTHTGESQVAVAEIYALDAQGKRLSREPWTIKYADSESFENGNKAGEKVYDLQESTYWQTDKEAQLPHLLVIDLGDKQTISGIEYLPRAEQGAPGSIKNYRIYIK